MIKAIVEYPHNQGQFPATLLIDVNDVKEYFDTISSDAGQYLNRLISSKAPNDKWDHMITNTPEGGIMLAALSNCQIKGGNPILEFDKHFNKIHKDILWSVAVNNKIVIVNPMGGYYTVDDESTVIKKWESNDTPKKSYTLNKDSKVINLENDDELEIRSRDYLSELDTNFSYICRLYQYTKDELTIIFDEFVNNGGEAVYVYTSGINVPQMYMYSYAAIDAGITDFIFEFNSGMTNQIREFINDIGLIVGKPPTVLNN